MLGDARFRGNSAALDLCLRLLPARDAEAVVAAAPAALQRSGDPGTARALEGLLWSLDAVTNRWKALQVLVALSGMEANAVLAGLWPRALDDADRAFLIGQVTPNEGTSSLALFELASYGSQPVRLQAALALGPLRFPEFPAFIQGWLARERDEPVRAALGAAEVEQCPARALERELRRRRPRRAVAAGRSAHLGRREG